MSQEENTTLTDKQKQLVWAFHMAAQYFKERLLDLDTALDLVASGDKPLKKLFDRHGAEQANSKIAEEAGAIFLDSSGLDEIAKESVVQLIKKAGGRGSINFIIADIIEVEGTKKAKFAEEARKSILENLFQSDFTIRKLPKNCIRKELRKIGIRLET